MNDYCEKQKYIIEAVFANPEKYSYKDREPLIEHIETCSACYEFFLRQATTEDF